MDTCFVIQPFNEKYDKRYESIYKPAIIEAGLTPYRVDEDISSEILIESIEAQIRSAKLCFADISENNPNVWYELGYAYAKEKKVVMVSSNERKGPFPFDISHRHVVTYNTENPDWAKQLGDKISNKIEAYLPETEEIKVFDEDSNYPESGTKNDQLKEYEIETLLSILDNGGLSYDPISSYKVLDDIEEKGYLRRTVSVAIKSLERKGFVVVRKMTDYQDNEYPCYYISEKGLDWVFANDNSIEWKIKPPSPDFDDEEVPF